MATEPEPVDPVDEELRALLQHPDVRKRLDDFERRRDAGLVGEGIPPVRSAGFLDYHQP